MSYLALYRAFRPSTLSEVVRQEHIVTILKNQILTGRIGHAYLFCGPRGTGKTSIAKIFARAINCVDTKDGSPCGKCDVCRALDDDSNLDVVEIDAASNNGVDEMRDLREKVQYPPVAGKYKVYIIDEVHMLSVGAFNALLKTLEEPPKHAVFILATTEAQKIPATILSRCMRFDFKLIPQADLEKQLRYVFDCIKKPYEEEAITAIARAGAGSVRDMLSIADACVSFSQGKLTYADVNEVLGSADFDSVCALCKDVLLADSGNAFQKTEDYLSAGKSVGTLIKDLMTCLNACALAKTCRDAKELLGYPDDRFALVLAIAKATDGHRILRVTEIFAETEMNLKYSSSPRVLFESAILKASMPSQDYDYESLISRIAALEKAVNDGGRVAVSVPESKVESEPVKVETVKEQPVEEEPYCDYGYDETPPPDEEETGGNVYFDAPIESQVKPAQKPEPKKIAVQPIEKGDAKTTFGAFLRTLRKASRSAVLVTMCMDLDCYYEDDKFICATPSETVFKSLQKPEHFEVVANAFAEIGLDKDSFEIRVKAKAGDSFDRAFAQLKKDFPGVRTELK